MNCLEQIPDDRLEFTKFIVSRYDDNILHVFIKPDCVIEMSDLKAITEYVETLGNRQYYNLFEFAKYSNADHEVRKWASDEDGNKRTIADALVINGLDQKIIADAYMNINKPIKPTRVFNNCKEALLWLLSLKNG